MLMKPKKPEYYKLIIWISNLSRSVRIGIFFAIVLPVFCLGLINFHRTKRDLGEYALSQRQVVAQFAALTVHEKLNQVKDLGISLATRVRFHELIGQGEWDKGIKIMSDVSKNFPIIDRIFITDYEGNLKSDSPLHPHLIGKNFKYRDWYRGVVKTGKAYVSDVYRREAEPRYNVVAVVIPIRDNQKIVGILGLQLIIDRALSAIKDIEIGQDGSIYITDSKGNLAAHRNYSSQDIIQDYSKVSVVKKALMGKHGVEVAYNPIEKVESIAAFEPVADYGWAVVAQQPTKTALALQLSNLKGLAIINSSILILTFAFALLILWIISLIKKTEEKLMKSQLFVDSVIENIPDMLIVKDINLHFLRINRAGEELLGFSRDELVGKSAYDFFSRTEAEMYTTKDQEVIFNKIKMDIPEEGIHTHHKGFRLIHTKRIPILGNGSKVEYLLAISEDITEKKAAEEMRLKLFKEQEARILAEHSIAIRDDFIAVASHELKTPITAIKLQLQLALRLLKGDNAKDKIDAKINATLRNVEQLTKLVDVLLDMTMIQSGNIVLKKEMLNLSEVVMNICTQYQSQLQGAGCEILFDLDKNITGVWDKVRIEQVITNIIVNAIKYASGNPIHIKVSGDDKYAILAIQDFGGGIPDSLKKKMFERFERGVSHEHISGFGLGLFIAERLINAHHGKIVAENGTSSSGAQFIIQLPRSE